MDSVSEMKVRETDMSLFLLSHQPQREKTDILFILPRWFPASPEKAQELLPVGKEVLLFSCLKAPFPLFRVFD